MIYYQHFIVEGKFLGTAARGLVPVHEELHPPRSFAYFCQTCGDVWARLPVEDHLGNQQPFSVLTVGCSKHRQHSLEVGGSLFTSRDPYMLDAFPWEVWARELSLHLDLFP